MRLIYYIGFVLTLIIACNSSNIDKASDVDESDHNIKIQPEEGVDSKTDVTHNAPTSPPSGGKVTSNKPDKPRTARDNFRIGSQGAVKPAKTGNPDEEKKDEDLDGVPDDSDNCPETKNVDQADADGDGDGDVCDNCPNDPNKTEPGNCGCGVSDEDSDNDGIADCNDNCPDTANADQADGDNDGVGDVCDCAPSDPNNECLRAFVTSDSYNGDLVSVANTLSTGTDLTDEFDCSADTYQGNFNWANSSGDSGVDAADCLCRERAQSADLTCSGGGFGCWKAWIGDNSVNSAPKSRFNLDSTANSDTPIYQVDTNGNQELTSPIAIGGWDDLVVCGQTSEPEDNGCLDDSMINTNGWLNENGERIGTGSLAWTNITNSGERSAFFTYCNLWASTTDSGTVGDTDSGTNDQFWTDTNNITCSNEARLYCFETP